MIGAIWDLEKWIVLILILKFQSTSNFQAEQEMFKINKIGGKETN